MKKTDNAELTDDEFNRLVGDGEAENTRSTKPLELETEDRDDEENQIGVKIDGVFYEYANPQNWSLFQRNEWKSIYEKLEKLEKVKEPTQQHEELYGAYSVKLLHKAVPDLPIDRLEYLNITKRAVLLMDFLLKSAERGGILAGMSTTFGRKLSSN